MDPVLSESERARLDDRPDDSFYDSPRFVTHADEGFLDTLTETYASVLTEGDRVLDAMSSWVSHLPAMDFGRVIGHGLNEAELAANDALDEWFVQDLNADPSLPLGDDTVDAVCCALSVQYLQYPGAVFGEFERVLAPDGALVVSFTNRYFQAKAVAAWREATMHDRTQLVESYFEAGGLEVVEVVRAIPERDPFIAVIGTPRE